MKKVLLFSLFLLSLGCSLNKGKEAENFEGFKTDESSKLYFKNIRRAYYDVTELQEAKLETYRLKKRVVESDEPIINLAIVNNWRYDEAYLLLEPNDQFSGLDDIKIRWQSGSSWKEIRFRNTNKESHLTFADAIYENISAEKKMEIWNGTEWLDFLQTSKPKEAFRISMVDYYRLVRRL